MEAFDARLREVIIERRKSADRPDDAMTALVEYRDDNGQPLSDDKILLHLSKDLITGGIDTTTHLVGNMFYDLLNTPGAYERVRDDRSLVPNTVEESLRYRPIVNTMFRHSAVDTEVRGTQIPKGSLVILGYRSANWDEDVFDHPEVFDVERGDAVKRHLGFGWGIHLCVGAALARVEGAHILNAVLDRIPTMRLAPSFTYDRVRFPDDARPAPPRSGDRGRSVGPTLGCERKRGGNHEQRRAGVRPPALDDGPPDDLAHYARNDELAAARKQGRAVKALCGTLFHPHTDPGRLQVCVVCADLAAGWR